MKNYIEITLALIVLCILVVTFSYVEATEIIDYDAEIQICEQEILFYGNMKTNAHAMAENARALGYSENHMIIICAKQDWEKAQTKYLEAINRKEELVAERDSVWRKREEEYPVATQCWRYLSEYGYNDYVIAGILGNMMAETGGHTLKIKTNIWDASGSYYGVCQWSLKYNPQLSGVSLETQLEHLVNSMEYEFNTFGYKYKSGFTYTDFIQMTDAKEAALAFAKCYERCASASYGKRQSNAIKAYDYFAS